MKLSSMIQRSNLYIMKEGTERQLMAWQFYDRSTFIYIYIY